MRNGNGIQRADFAAIAGWIRMNSSVLDLGCGDGSLLKYLRESRRATGYGVEIDDGRVLECVKSGVNVIQSDLEHELSEFADRSFDYVILSQTLQAVRHSERIIREMLRVGREGIVTFPNFGYWKNRLQVAAGNMPVSDHLRYEWFETPNIHLCTIDDFERFCASHRVKILERKVLTDDRAVTWWPNLLGELAVYHFGNGSAAVARDEVMKK